MNLFPGRALRKDMSHGIVNPTWNYVSGYEIMTSGPICYREPKQRETGIHDATVVNFRSLGSLDSAEHKVSRLAGSMQTIEWHQM